MSSSLETPVLIVGGGPVGLATALDLAIRGTESVVVERDASTGAELLAKAGTLNERTMEICRWWGVRDDVANCGFPDDVILDTVYCTSLEGLLIGVDPRPSARNRVAPPGAREILRKAPQFQFDPILARHVMESGKTTVLYGHDFDRLEQDADGVTAYLTDNQSGEAKTVRARYLVAADGAGSAIRRGLGLKFEGPLLSYSVSAMITADLEHTKFGIRNRYMFIDENGTWANLTSVDGYKLWRFTLVGNEDRLDPKVHDIRLDIQRAFGPDIPFEIHRVLPWRRSQCIIERYREGRVLFVGDAAHTTSPTGGHGLNTGIGDALGIGWMLHAVLSGWGGPGLLDAYGQERRHVGIRNSSLSTDNFKLWLAGADFSKVMLETEEGEKARHAAGQRLNQVLVDEWVSFGVGLGYRFEGSPIIVPDGTPEPPDTISTYVQTARPGHRAPHAWLSEGVSTIDLFGKEFVLLRFGGDPAETQPLIDVATARGVPFKTVDIADPEIAALYERRYVLVRPDGHVAWRDDVPPSDPEQLIRRVTGFEVMAAKTEPAATQVA